MPQRHHHEAGHLRRLVQGLPWKAGAGVVVTTWDLCLMYGRRTSTTSSRNSRLVLRESPAAVAAAGAPTSKLLPHSLVGDRCNLQHSSHYTWAPQAAWHLVLDIIPKVEGVRRVARRHRDGLSPRRGQAVSVLAGLLLQIEQVVAPRPPGHRQAALHMLVQRAHQHRTIISPNRQKHQ